MKLKIIILLLLASARGSALADPPPVPVGDLQVFSPDELILIESYPPFMEAAIRERLANGEEVPMAEEQAIVEAMPPRLLPPTKPRIVKWEAGQIINLDFEHKTFAVYVPGKWHDLQICTNLVEGSWELLERFDSEDALNERIKIILPEMEAKTAAYRIVIRTKPHPPTSIHNLGQSSYISTNRPHGGGFKKDGEWVKR